MGNAHDTFNPAEIDAPPPLPAGEYCIAEFFGHVTIVGRYREVEMFGVKMLAIEPLFRNTLLPVVVHGGASIYRLTPCEVETARKHQPMEDYQLPPSIRANVPVRLLPATAEPSRRYTEVEDDDDDITF